MEFENIMQMIQAVSDSSISGFTYEENGVKLQIEKEVGKEISVIPVQPKTSVETEIIPLQTANSKEVQMEGKLIKSPLVGMFYKAPAEDAEPFIQVGDKVTKGQTVGIVEAMKLMNDIECEYDGVIAEVLVENGDAVEYGQPLFRVI